MLLTIYLGGNKIIMSKKLCSYEIFNYFLFIHILKYNKILKFVQLIRQNYKL